MSIDYAGQTMSIEYATQLKFKYLRQNKLKLQKEEQVFTQLSSCFQASYQYMKTISMT